MQNSKLIAILRALESAELTALQYYIQSPYFFKGHCPQRVIQLLDYLVAVHPSFEAAAIEKEHVHHVLFPDQAYKQKTIDTLMSKLFKIIERFVIQQQQELTAVEEGLVLGRFFRKRGMEIQAERNMVKMQKTLAAAPRRGDVYFRHQYLIAREVVELRGSSRLRDSDLNLPNLHQQLDIYYLVNKLDFACKLLAQNKHHRPIAVEDSVAVVDHLIPLFRQGRFEEIPLLKLYMEVYMWLRENKPPPDNFIQSLRDYSPLLPVDQLKSIHTFYRNDCIRRYNENDQAYLPALFEIYLLSLEEGLLFVEGCLLQSTLQNMVMLGLKMKRYEWVYEFLRKYKDKIIYTNNPQEVYTYNLARYYFALKEFDKALNCLSQDYDDIYYKIIAKLIAIKIYYEQESELLDYRMQALKIYLHRISDDVLPDLHKMGFKHFIDLLRQICHPSTLKNEERIDKLLSKVKEQKVVAERDWLIEKLEELR